MHELKQNRPASTHMPTPECTYVRKGGSHVARDRGSHVSPHEDASEDSSSTDAWPSNGLTMHMNMLASIAQSGLPNKMSDISAAL